MNKGIIFLFFITNSIFPQTNTILKSNLTDIIVGRYSIGLETKIRDSFSLGLDIDLINKSVNLESYHPWYPFTCADKQGLIFEPQIRWYNLKKDTLTNLHNNLKVLYKKKKIRKIIIYFYSLLMNEKLRQNIFFFKYKIKQKILHLFKKN